MDLLSLVDVRVILRDTLQGELFHEVDLIGLVEEFVLECFYNHREGGRVKKDLAGFREKGDELLDDRLEFGRQQLVGLVHDEDLRL